MQFTQSLRSGIKAGEITTSIRVWQRPRVIVGNRYRMDEGFVIIESILEINLEDITGNMARNSGFSGVAELLKIAKHGRGENVYFIKFCYIDK